jgi:hypothetical protein
MNVQMILRRSNDILEKGPEIDLVYTNYCRKTIILMAHYPISGLNARESDLFTLWEADNA